MSASPLTFGEIIYWKTTRYKFLTSSSYQLASVSQCHAHSREAVFHILHRGQRDNRLCPLTSKIFYLYYFLVLRPGSLTLRDLRHYSPLSFSAAAAAASLALSILMPTYSHHCIPTRAPSALSDPSHRSSINRVEIYNFWHLC